MVREIEIVRGIIANQTGGVLRELDRTVDVLTDRSTGEAGQDEEGREDVFLHCTDSVQVTVVYRSPATTAVVLRLRQISCAAPRRVGASR
jgi:hypothetical protein